MAFCGTDARAGLTNKRRASVFATLLIPLFLACAGSERIACAQRPGGTGLIVNGPLSGEQVVDNLIAMNIERTHALHEYRGTRHYLLQYHGFAGTHSAEMVVDLRYQSAGTKEFTIRSSAGSTLIINRVFKKLLEAEQEALGVEAQKRAALDRDNYNFTLVGYESTRSGSMYVLGVEPRAEGKFLYRGRIWVDAKNFAITRLEAQPAKNPSFWTEHIEIEEAYMQVGDFWLPARNHSVTKIRFGGSAVLTIQYQNYKITSADAVSGLR